VTRPTRTSALTLVRWTTTARVALGTGPSTWRVRSGCSRPTRSTWIGTATAGAVRTEPSGFRALGCPTPRPSLAGPGRLGVARRRLPSRCPRRRRRGRGCSPPRARRRLPMAPSAPTIVPDDGSWTDCAERWFPPHLAPGSAPAARGAGGPPEHSPAPLTRLSEPPERAVLGVIDQCRNRRCHEHREGRPSATSGGSSAPPRPGRAKSLGAVSTAPLAGAEAALEVSRRRTPPARGRWPPGRRCAPAPPGPGGAPLAADPPSLVPCRAATEGSPHR
jgi:hypothetical protein